jgi:hypothetical protein
MSPPQLAVIGVPEAGDWLALLFLSYRVPLLILIVFSARRRFQPFLVDSQHDPCITVGHLAHLVFRRGAQHLRYLQRRTRSDGYHVGRKEVAAGPPEKSALSSYAFPGLITRLLNK